MISSVWKVPSFIHQRGDEEIIFSLSLSVSHSCGGISVRFLTLLRVIGVSLCSLHLDFGWIVSTPWFLSCSVWDDSGAVAVRHFPLVSTSWSTRCRTRSNHHQGFLLPGFIYRCYLCGSPSLLSALRFILMRLISLGTAVGPTSAVVVFQLLKVDVHTWCTGDNKL